ncbi:MAG: 1-deoxy-D-xylulose-5-phosphate reductoisomerase [Spirochaetales bacterium]|nr:1-deoxy-D-xylulose-5-phosphate reductoisomerase [Spirochaetales bacterium]
MRTVAVLGITGSIGTTALRGISEFTDRITVVAASCNSRVDEALEICKTHKISNLCITSDHQTFRDGDVVQGNRIWKNLRAMLNEVHADMVLNGIAGSPGLIASFIAMESGSDLALANKESVVLGGNLLFDKAKECNVRIIPVDSEHSAIDELILQCGRDNVEKLVITASGGPFRNIPIEELDSITPQQAANHPTWNMGPKISIDSSTLANKGLEVIEAHFLFGFDADHIEVVIHPQSVVHSMVRTRSGQIYAQMSPPDMVFPIMRALLWPTVDRQVGKALDFTALDLSFRKLDPNRFPFVTDAFECVRLEGSYPIVYNTANEVAVDRFRKGQLKYTQIRNTVRTMLDLDWTYRPQSLEDILDVQNQVIRKMEGR